MWTVIGRVVSSQGLKGEVRIYPDTDFPERFLTPGKRWLRRQPNAEPELLTLVTGRCLEGKGLYVVQFAEIQQREQADALKNAEILVSAQDRPPLEPGEFHVSDLVGLEVRLQTNGEAIGIVVDLFAAGNDLLAVELFAQTDPKAGGEPVKVSSGRSSSRSPKTSSRKLLPVLVPFVHEIVPTVNLAEGFLEINPPPGLLDE
ncbi:ribosome maturation factor RimM [Leptolyngbya sp. PCC 6406]|uniref:ribosome maturation factor RimM n=1 Tax=Leptolyngbya sp. PCC 6406 TaxID=1173264 RepID=UPI0002AC24E2|nr:ribosome maturation factor RimM [Leptolyngbya sp. PCC 6406]